MNETVEPGQMRVSVVMPSYNVAQWIEVAVRSVLAQTETDFEIVIVDDGSTDDTFALATRLSQEDARIRVVRNPRNGGRMMAMNYGLSEARGRWVAVLDADDWYAPNRLKRLLDAGEAAPVDMVADDWIAVDNKAGLCLESPLPRRTGDIVLDLDQFLAKTDPMAKGDYGMLKGIVRRDFLKRTGITYYEKARTGEDFYFLLSFFLAGGQCLLVNEALYYYVEPFGSVSRAWAQEGRKRYKFEILVDVNRHFVDTYANTLTPLQKHYLLKRDAGWQALIAYHQALEAWAEGKRLTALGKIVRAPFSFWIMVANRGALRLKRMTYGSPRRILGPVEMPASSANASA